MSSSQEINRATIMEEDEIDLRELWQTIVAGKKIIAALTTVIVTLTLVYALSLPNIYKSEAMLIPSEEKAGGLSGLGGLGGLAAMAGVNIGSGGSMTPDVAFGSLLANYEFMRNFVIENKILEHYTNAETDKEYVFALGFRGVYELFNAKKGSNEGDYEDVVYQTVQAVSAKFAIGSDKKTGLISVSYMDADRAYAPEIINLFLKDASKYLVSNNLRIINDKLGYFEAELRKSESYELRQSLSAIISKILEEKVMMHSKVYYQCDVLTPPAKAYIKDKAKPKRGLILVVSFVTSIILGVFFVFFLQFIRSEKSEEKTPII